MFKKTIKFEDFNGQEQTQDFYFHMSKAELLTMAAGGNQMMLRIQRIIDSNDGRAILKEFRDIIEASIGMRSEDGSRFIKDEAAKSALMDSPAYDELLMELCTNAEAASQFVKELIPEKMQEEMRKHLAQGQKQDAPDPFKEAEDDDPRPAWLKENRNPTEQELRNMTKEELQMAFRHRSPNN
jgi:hypothetical protein